MTLSIGVAGLGTVGQGVVKGIQQNAELLRNRTGQNIAVTAVSALEKKGLDIDVSACTWFSDARELATSDSIDVFIEVIGGYGIALDCVKLALNAGKVVITANKAMLAEQGEVLEKIAKANNTTILYEAAIGGGIPLVKALREGLGGNKIHRIYGILNGTCNYILTTIEKTGRDFADVLQEAQNLGYAEADPSFDVDGLDASQKLSLLASIAFGIKGAYNQMHIETIRDCMQNLDINIASDLGYTPRLVGVAQNTENGVHLYTAPAFVSKTGTFGGVDDVVNACTIEGDLIGSTTLTGPGAGRFPTASAIISDVFDVATRGGLKMFNQPVENLTDTPILPMDARVGRYYVRANKDIRQNLADNHIQVEQTHIGEGYTAIITAKTTENTFKIATQDTECVWHRVEEC